MKQAPQPLSLLQSVLISGEIHAENGCLCVNNLSCIKNMSPECKSRELLQPEKGKTAFNAHPPPLLVVVGIAS